jgi:hypothetical protein
VKLYDKLFSSDEREESDTDQSEENEVEVLDLDASIKSFQPKQTPKSFDLKKTFERDLAYFEGTRQKPESLKKLSIALMSIKPTSTYCEQVFSVAVNFKNKIRNRTSEKFLDALVWLKKFFLRN